MKIKNTTYCIKTVQKIIRKLKVLSDSLYKNGKAKLDILDL